MKLFFDTEFTGLRKDTTLISIGIVSEDGRKFYAEFVDYDRSKVTPWIKENVINQLKFQVPISEEDYYYVASRAKFNSRGNDLLSAWNLDMNGTKEIVMESLNQWLSQFDIIQFISDVCHYDFVLLIDLLTNGGTAIDLPETISAVCHDINQDIANHFNVPERIAFDMSREEVMRIVCPLNKIVTGDKHNSLYDAEVIKAIWEQIH